MTKFILLLLLSFSLALVLAQDPTEAPRTEGDSWGGCVDPNNLGADSRLQVGKPHHICITIGPGGHWSSGVSYLRYMFVPVADEYSRFHVPGSYAAFAQSTQPVIPGNLTVHTASQDLLSFLRIWYDPDAGRIYPFLTAIFNVRNGVVQSISWDDACVFCNKQRCVENMFNFNGVSSTELNINQPSRGCFIEVERCNELHGNGGTDCDLTLYVVWTGTDVNGRPFLSAPNRFSSFPPQRLQDRVLNLVPDINIPIR